MKKLIAFLALAFTASMLSTGVSHATAAPPGDTDQFSKVTATRAFQNDYMVVTIADVTRNAEVVLPSVQQYFLEVQAAAVVVASCDVTPQIEPLRKGSMSNAPPSIRRLRCQA